jgi:hypothetical protein
MIIRGCREDDLALLERHNPSPGQTPTPGTLAGCAVDLGFRGAVGVELVRAAGWLLGWTGGGGSW